MRKIAMSQEARLKDALRRRRLAWAGRWAVMALVLTAAAGWVYLLLSDT